MSRLLPVLFVCATALPLSATEKPFAFGAVRFEANRGQTDSSVRYMARARGQQIFFTDTGIVFSPPAGPAIRMAFARAGRPEWVADGPPSDSISYYIGRDPSQWVKGAPVYDRITWRGVYPGVDVTFYGAGDRLEYDLVLAPGADPSRVRLEFASPAHVRRNAGEVLEVSVGATTIRQRVPAIYQEMVLGARRKVAGDFQSAGPHAATLTVASYDRAERLVVDPVIEMATYFGGENDDEIVAIADGFVAGNTRSLVFPPLQPALRGGRDVFLRGTGQLIPGQTPRTTFYGTVVIGGSGDEELAGIALQSSFGYITLAGTTTSEDLPAAGASQYGGGASDGFLANVQVSLKYSSLRDSVYIGGSGEDRITAFGGNGSTHGIAGVTDSPDFPVVGNVPQATSGGGKDAFYGIVSPLMGSGRYGYLGGSGDDAAYAVSVSASGVVWIGGETRSSDFPFPDPGLSGPSDGFLAEIRWTYSSSTVTVTSASAYRVGGNGEDRVQAVAAGPSTMTASVGSSQVVRPITPTDIGFGGTTTSTDLGVHNAAGAGFAGGRDGFAGLWNVTTAAPRWVSYLGGSGDDEVTAVTEDWAGGLYAGGWTRSTDVPVARALQPQSAGGEDGLFAVFDDAGSLLHLTYYGGSGDDRIRSVRLIYGSVARVAGSTTSTDLPERSPFQDRGGQADGFWADIGSDHLIGPSELMIAKDGLLSFSVRPGRTAFRNPVTYRTSDPSRVRLVYAGRSVDEVTAAPEDNMAIEALADSGEASITITAPGFTTKVIAVKLYPGAFVPALSSASSFSTWAGPVSVIAIYRPVDPATGLPISVGNMTLRAGVPPATPIWTVSDPSVFSIINSFGSAQIQALKPGGVTLSLTIDGYTVVQGDRTITAVTPSPLPAYREFRLGRDLYVNLPLAFGLNGAITNTGHRGTLTARSSDPSRLLLSLNSNQLGHESVTVTMSGSAPTISAQALASEGTVPVYLTSSEFEGEIPVTATLEPAVVQLGSFRYTEAGGTKVDPVVSLTAGVQATQMAFRIQGQSGSVASGRRPGAPPVTIRLSNSDPKTVELNRLTRVVDSDGDAYRLFGLAPGTAELTVTTSSDDLRPESESVHVEVTGAASAAAAATVPSTVYVGKGLQTSVTISHLSSPEGIEAFSDDADAVLVSASKLVRGSARAALTKTGSAESAFLIQGLKSDGETRVRLRFPTGDEREIRVVLLPAGAGFWTAGSDSAAQGFDRSVAVRAWALDRQTGIGVFSQIPQPDSPIAVQFRSEGAAVRLSAAAATLTADEDAVQLSYSLPPAGEEATLITESDAGAAVSPVTTRMRIHATTVTPTRGTLLLARDELRGYNISWAATGSSLIVTSSAPDRVLLSATATAPGSPSLVIDKPIDTIFIHALADSGNATVRAEAAGVLVREIEVALQPLALRTSYGGAVTVGASTVYTVSLSVYGLRPNTGPFAFSVQSSDPSVLTVEPATFELGGAATPSAKVQVLGVAPGIANLVFSGPPEIKADPVVVLVGVAVPLAVPEYTLGKNLQGGVQIDLGSSFDNPNGAIVRLASSDPGRLLLSRAVSTVGSASVNVAVPAGEHRTQRIYLQALEEGDVNIQVTANDTTRGAAAIHVAHSWVSCGSQPSVVVAGSTVNATCGIRYSSTSTNYLDQISTRAGLEDVDLSLESSAPDVFTVTPRRVSLQSINGQVVLRGISPGAGELRLSSPAAFGPSPDESETLAVSVVEPSLSTGCSRELVLGKDMQLTCTFWVASGVTVTATSHDATRLLVSADAQAVGAATAAATATAVSSGTGVAFTFQGLASSGTVEVVLSAPGYQDLRVAVALRQTEFYWSSLSYSSNSISMHAGDSAVLTVGLRATGGSATPRAGANVAVDVLMDPLGLITLEPTHVVFDGPASGGQVHVHATAPGSVLLRIAAPDGFSASTVPVLVNVLP